MRNHEQAQSILEKAYLDILSVLGDDPNRPELSKTAKRAASGLLALTKSYEQSLDEILDGAAYATDSDQLVLLKNIEFHSVCEHHLLPFFGRCHVAYLPDQSLLGLSKISRIVHFHAKRLQIQERLTQNIADTILKATSARGVAVIMQAHHLCLNLLGSENQNTELTTHVTLGVFKNQSQLHQTFLELIK